jgi:hypothetical protein
VLIVCSEVGTTLEGPMNQIITEEISMTQGIPAPVQSVLELFSGELAGLKFPDLDAEVLRQALQGLCADAAAQSRAEEALQAAREALQESQEALLQKCQRAMAYAKVYAEDNPELLQRLEQITLPRSGRSRMSSPPGFSDSRPTARRSRRQPPTSGPLFLEPGAATPTHSDEHPALEQAA